jgi:hypothetical protein
VLRQVHCLLLLVLATCGVAAAEVSPALLELNKAAFFHGREYFVLRSGRAQTVVQADRADLGPAFTWLLFDAQDAKQSARKESAFNFVPKEGFGSSALEVMLGGFPFTALGHRTDTRWVVEEGIPSVEAVWWAGGVRVTERISALAAGGTFRRTVQSEGAHLVSEESVLLRLHLPPSGVQSEGKLLLQTRDRARLALTVADATPVRVDPTTAMLEIGPVAITPRGSTVVETLLLVQVPAGDRAQFVVQAREIATSRMAPTLRETAGSWTAVSSVATRDLTVQEIFDKARFGLAGMIGPDGTMDAGIFEYGGQ